MLRTRRHNIRANDTNANESTRAASCDHPWRPRPSVVSRELPMTDLAERRARMHNSLVSIAESNLEIHKLDLRSIVECCKSIAKTQHEILENLEAFGQLLDADGSYAAVDIYFNCGNRLHDIRARTSDLMAAYERYRDDVAEWLTILESSGQSTRHWCTAASDHGNPVRPGQATRFEPGQDLHEPMQAQ